MTDERVGHTLAQMRDAAALAHSYVKGMTQEAFAADTRTQQAVIMNLVIIGELSTKLLKDHADFVTRNPQIPWVSMKGMRNRIAHGYFEVNLEVVWITVKTALPELQQQLMVALHSLQSKR